jgi:hypothetical protein
VQRFAVIARSDLRWVAFIFGGIAFLFGVALLIGMALAELPLIFGAAVAFIVVALIVALIAFALPRFCVRLPH